MEQIIFDKYDQFYEGCTVDTVREFKPDSMSDNAYFKQLHKICNVSTIGKDKKKFYKLTPENAIRFCPTIQEYFKSGAMNEEDVRVGIALEFNLDLYSKLTCASHQRKLEIIIDEVIWRSLCGAKFNERYGRFKPYNVFRSDEKDWTTAIRGEARDILPDFNARHECKLVIKDDAFHKKCLVVIEKVRSLIHKQ